MGELTWRKTGPMWDAAARAWARVRSSGPPHDDDADLLIAAFTRALRATFVTNHGSDFAHLGLPLHVSVHHGGTETRRADGRLIIQEIQPR